jgi:hypothetical protein
LDTPLQTLAGGDRIHLFEEDMPQRRFRLRHDARQSID